MCSGKFCHQSILSSVYQFVTILYKIILWWFDQNLKRKRINTQPTLILMTKRKAGIYRTVRSKSGLRRTGPLLGWNGPRRLGGRPRTSNLKICWDVRGRWGRRRLAEAWSEYSSKVRLTGRSCSWILDGRRKSSSTDRRRIFISLWRSKCSCSSCHHK